MFLKCALFVIVPENIFSYLNRHRIVNDINPIQLDLIADHGTNTIFVQLLFLRETTFHQVRWRNLAFECPCIFFDLTMSCRPFAFHPSIHRTGYLRHKKAYQDPVQLAANIGIKAAGADGVSLQDKVVVVTGANSGLGKEVATYAAAKGAKLYMLCRSEQRAQQAKDEIVKATSNSNIHVVLADVSELSQVKSAVQQIQSAETHVDALVCNAGVLLNDFTKTSEGREVTFVAHLLGGSYLLSQLLLPQLKAAPSGRVVFVTSGGMYNYKLPPWDVVTTADESKYNGVDAYAYAKRGQVLLAERLAETIPEVMWVTVHPGWADTPAVDDAFGDAKKYLKPLRDPWEGAEGVTWLLGADKDTLENGSLYLDRKTQPKHIAGPFFSEGSFTKNTAKDVDEMMEKLKEAAGV